MEADHDQLRVAIQKAAAHENQTAAGSVLAAYLHGSRARGKADQESDIDIGFLAGPTLDKEQRFNLRLRLMSALDESLPSSLSGKLDVIMLQDVPVLLQFNAIRNGVILFEHDRGVRIAYELHVEQAYDDERYYLERESGMTLKRILSRSAA